jgi:aspartyl-tRNA(Asn)/glutamyl-tRNA(Gln) amidotransferase subunit C
MTGVEDGAMELRDDVPLEGLSSQDAFRNAPEMESDHFVIPKVIGG